MRLHHLAVLVTDLARAEAFYAGVLGLAVVTRHADATGAPRSIWLDAQGTVLMLERAEATLPARADAAPGWHCMALEITADTRATWRGRLVNAGFPIVRETAHTLYVRDPDGALVALSTYPMPQPPGPGAIGSSAEVAPPGKAT